MFKKIFFNGLERTQQLRTPAVLPKDSSWFPAPTTAHIIRSLLLGDSMSSSGLWAACSQLVYGHACRENSRTHRIFLKDCLNSFSNLIQLSEVKIYIYTTIPLPMGKSQHCSTELTPLRHCQRLVSKGLRVS